MKTQRLSAHAAVMVLLATVFPTYASLSFNVETLPLTTQAQRQAGVPGGEGFQQVLSMVYSPSDPNIVYLGSDTSQVWKSIDGGHSWQPRNAGHHSVGSRSLFVHPANPKIVFSAGTLGKPASKLGSHQPVQGIFRTSDGGATWSLVHRTGFYRQESRGDLFAMDSRTRSDKNFTIYAGSYPEGLLISRDGGLSWKATGVNPGEIFDLLELPDRPGTLLISTNQGLFSFDGTALSEIGKGLTDWPRSIAASIAAPGVIFAALGETGVFRSGDNGLNFERLLPTIPLLGSINDVYISPIDHNFALFTKSGKRPGPYYSNDGGVSWRASRSVNSKGMTEGGGFFFPSPVAMHPTDSNVALTSSNGQARVLRTEDGGKNWSYSGSGYMGARLSSIIFLSSARMILNLTDHGPWLTEDSGATFAPIEVPRRGAYSVSDGVQIDNTYVFAVGTWHQKHLVVSQDGGKSWHDTGLKGRFDLVSSHRARKGTIYAGRYRSDDSGNSWRRLDYAILATHPTDSDTVYSVEPAENSAQLLVSRNAGETWQPLAKPIPVAGDRINQIACDPQVNERIYVAAAGGLWILEKGRWHLRNNQHGMTPDAYGGTYVANVAAHPNIPGLLFAGRRSPFKGMGNGLFYSDDWGNTWDKVDTGLLSNTNIWSISISPYDNRVYAGTAHGILTITIDEPGQPGSLQ